MPQAALGSSCLPKLWYVSRTAGVFSKNQKAVIFSKEAGDRSSPLFHARDKKS
jgi:hypothetical protein